MNSFRRLAAVAAVIGAASTSLIAMPRGAGQSAEPTPAFHSEVPDGPLPATLDPAQFDNPVVQNAYMKAAKVRKVLYQQPCYCHCDRSIGHGSLLDCFTGKHASVCDVCIKEAFYSYEQTQKKKTAAQIRTGIENGEWQKVDVSKYEQYPAKP